MLGAESRVVGIRWVWHAKLQSIPAVLVVRSGPAGLHSGRVCRRLQTRGIAGKQQVPVSISRVVARARDRDDIDTGSGDRPQWDLRLLIGVVDVIVADDRMAH